MPKIQDADISHKDAAPASVEDMPKYARRANEHEQFSGMNSQNEDFEAFMNEIVHVTIHESLSQNDVMAIPLQVNDDVQYVIRGFMTPVKRKYVEVLARARETRWQQQQQNAFDPASSRPMPKTGLSYPFATHGDTPRGNAWLRHILAQPN